MSQLKCVGNYKLAEMKKGFHAMLNVTLSENLHARNSHVQFDEGEVALTKPRCSTLLCKSQRILLTTFVTISIACSARAGKTFTFAPGESIGYINDSARWAGDSGGDRHCSQAGTILITNGVSCGYWQFEYGSSDPTKPTVVRVLSGGDASNDFRPGGQANRYGVLDIEPGGKISGGAVVGVSGYGVATNRGFLYISSPLQIGLNAGSVGTYVHAGSSNSFRYPKDLYVGRAGQGELIVEEEKEFWWRYYSHNGNGDVIVGRSQSDNRIVVNNAAKFRAGYVYLGGKTVAEAGKDWNGVGRGELFLRGGVFSNTFDNGSKDDLFWLGCCSDVDGQIDPNSFGRIRGWGLFTGDDMSRTAGRGIFIRLGYGEVVGDGEGDESHVLKCYNGIYQVTNALPGVVTESGWRAVNKGAVCLPGYTGGDGDKSTLAGCVGCDITQVKPNLVNAVRMRANGLVPGANKYFGVQVLASDRTDAHTNSLPVGANVLSTWRVGVFTDPANQTTPSSVTTATIDFRYDQTKLKKTTTRIELLRYQEATGRWTRLNRLNPEVRPADCVISTPTAVTRVDEMYNLGTFAVIESEVKGFVVIFK